MFFAFFKLQTSNRNLKGSFFSFAAFPPFAQRVTKARTNGVTHVEAYMGLCPWLVIAPDVRVFVSFLLFFFSRAGSAFHHSLRRDGRPRRWSRQSCRALRRRKGQAATPFPLLAMAKICLSSICIFLKNILTNYYNTTWKQVEHEIRKA